VFEIIPYKNAPVFLQTAVTLIGALHLLATNPAKQDKLRDEINQALPTKDSALTVDNMKNLPYLRAVIKETLRLRPAVIGTLRATGQDLVIQGYQIPQGVMAMKSDSREIS
jgi:cytochrome P450 family 12